MMYGGHGNGHGIHQTEQVLHAGKSLAAKLRCHRLGLRGVGVYNRRKLNTLLLFFQFVIHTGMVAAKRAHTNDCYADCTFVSQVTDFLRGCHPIAKAMICIRALGLCSQ